MNIKGAIISLLLCFLAFNVNAKSNVPYHVVVTESVKANKYNRQLGYQLTNGGEDITFIFCPADWKIKNPDRVFVSGSFNGWSKKSLTWELTKQKDTLWTLECKAEDVMIPGESGFPEFTFFVIADVEYIETVCGKSLTRYKKENFEPEAISRVPGYKLNGKCLILRPEDNPDDVVQSEPFTKKAKKLKDFNLDSEDDRSAISNFRLVEGTSNLYRGYHPYKMSNSKLDTEQERIKIVNENIKNNGIQSVISLVGKEEIDPKKESISVYLTDIMRKGDYLFEDSEYATVYYKSTSKEFGILMADVIHFINNHLGPFYIHCDFGSDRTGVVCGVLSGLCGASWEDIVSDFQKSNKMYIKEFRDYKLLQYSLESILGHKIDIDTNLKEELTDYFVGRKFVSKNDIDELVSNLL